MMADLDKEQISHYEQQDPTEKQFDEPAHTHVTPTLLSMPDAPTVDHLTKAVVLAEAEKVQHVRAAFGQEMKIVAACLCYILPAIGQGFDSGAGSISVNMPAFKIKFGHFVVETQTLIIASLWLALWNASSSAGNAIGSFATGALTDRFGYRKSQLYGCAFSIATVFLQVFAVNRIMILMGKLLNGISMGLFVAISAGYISEVAGPKVRATMMSVLAASPIFGIIAAVAIGSTSTIIGNLSDWGSWRLIFALQWLLPAMAIPCVLLVPESPIQLVKQGKPGQALAALKRLRPKETEEDARVRLAGVQLAVASSIDEAQSQSVGYAECFKGFDRKRTLTVIIMFCGTQFAGVGLLSNGLYFLSQTGLDFTVVSDIALGFLGLSAIVCIGASFLLEFFGRRNTLVYGSAFHACLLTLIGGLYYSQTKAGLLVAAMLFNVAISTAQFASGAPVYALAIEVSSVRLRSKTQSLGFAAYYLVGWVFLFSVPYMFQAAPEGAGWGVRTCWLFAGLTFGFAIWAYYWVGETKGRSYADIDELYKRKVSPRNFAGMDVHAEREAVA